MNLLETTKRAVERATGLARPPDPAALVRRRKPQLYRFKDDGLVPNHPRWALIVYRGAVRLSASLDTAAVFEALFDRNGWGDSWRNGVYPYVHYHSRIHEVLGIARGSAIVQFGGPRGRKLRVKAGDAAVLPAGTGHQCLESSDDFLVIGAYPPRGVYDECTTIRERAHAKKTIPKVPRPSKDPVYGKAGPLLRVWKLA